MTKLTTLVLLLAAAGCGGQRAPEAAAPPAAPPPTAPAAPPTVDDPPVAALPPTPDPTPTPAPPPVDTFPADCSVTPPSQAMRDVLWGSLSDKKPEMLDGVRPEKFGQHYYVSDEGHADMFKPYIDGIGGGYVGIGSDQAYLYIGWARPQFAWTVDYDDEVVGMHELQQAFIAAAATPDEYRTLWSKERTADAKAIIAQIAPEGPQRKRLVRILGQGQPRMKRRMTRLAKHLTVPSYLTDQATYDFLRNLIKHGCMRPLLVDLLADKGMKGIGEVMHQVGLPVRVLYMSNAEEYWAYTDQFRANVRGLPIDDRSLALHTQASNANEDYRYTAQPMKLFVTWLDSGVRNIDAMLTRVAVKGPGHYPTRLFDQTPEQAKAERGAKKPRKKPAATP
jgi:hypothetical protein